MHALGSLFALLGDGSKAVALESVQAEWTRLVADPALREALAPARDLFDDPAPTHLMQRALDAPGTPLFEAAMEYLPSWKAPVLVHARLDLPLLKVGAILAIGDAIAIGHDKGVTTLDRATLAVQVTEPVRGFARHVHRTPGGSLRALVARGKRWSLVEGGVTARDDLFPAAAAESFVFEGALGCRFTPTHLAWIDLDAPSPEVQHVALAVAPGRVPAVDGASGRVLWLEGPSVVLFHAREGRREVYPVPGARKVAFLADGSPGANAPGGWQTLSPAHATDLEPRRPTLRGLHVNLQDPPSGDELHVWTKTHRCVCPLGAGDFDQLVVIDDLVFVASSKQPARVQAIGFFERP